MYSNVYTCIFVRYKGVSVPPTKTHTNTNTSKGENDRKCPLTTSTVNLLSCLARTRKYDEVMKMDCMSVLIAYVTSEENQNM
jgi:hypothetical protein